MAGAMHSRQPNAGFTLIELLVVLAIIILLASLSFLNFGHPQEANNSAAALDLLAADLKAEQNLAMYGSTGGQATAQPFGIYIAADHYVIFSGSSYNAADSSNFTVTPPAGVSLSTNLPSSQVVFGKGNGEVQGYSAGSDTITLASGSTTHTITINRFGALIIN